MAADDHAAASVRVAPSFHDAECERKAAWTDFLWCGCRDRAAAIRVAALYVYGDGIYDDLPGIDLWDEKRDARLYNGPHPVIAHPPCKRWSLMGQCRGLRDGIDGGCFKAALNAVRTYGGVLEHPAHSLAWERFDLPRPAGAGWVGGFWDGGYSCEVDQRWYGHEANKPTWLYAYGCELPSLQWGRAPKGEKTVGRSWGQGRDHQRSGTPAAFRDVLLDMARSVRLECAA